LVIATTAPKGLKAYVVVVIYLALHIIIAVNPITVAVKTVKSQMHPMYKKKYD
jgi:hypothetical protein